MFDFSFSQFVTVSLIRILYAVGMIAEVLAAIVFIVAGIIQGGAGGLGIVVLSIVGFVLYVFLFRVQLEVIVLSMQFSGTPWE